MSNAFESLNKLIELAKSPIPEIRLPRRENDCPAAPVCESVGNLRKACCAGSSSFADPNTNICIAGLILLVSRAFGMWTQEMIQETEDRRKIGFGPDRQQGEK